MPSNNNHSKTVLPTQPATSENQVEIIDSQVISAHEPTAVTLSPDELKVKKGGNIIIGTLNIFVSPAKNRWQQHYSPQQHKYGYWHLTIDLVLAAIILILIAFNLFLMFFSPQNNNNLSGGFVPHGTSQQASTTENVPAAVSNLILSLTSAEKNIDLGQSYSYVLKYENRESFTLKDLRIKAVFDEKIADGENTLTWSKEQLPQLASVGPGEIGEIKFSIKIKNSLAQKSADDKNFALSGHAEALYRDNGKNSSPVFSTSQSLNQKINTESRVVAFARYYTEEGDQLGFGPLPPQAGQSTKYWVFLDLENKYNDLNDIAIIAQLPDNVSWTNHFSATNGSAITYDPENKKINWTIDKVYAPSNFLPSVGAAFEVEIVPNAGQVGSAATLLNNLSLSASDDFTGQQINFELASPITTDLVHDQFEKSGGKVIQ